MRDPQGIENFLRTPINVIKGSREALEELLKKLCEFGYLKTDYNEVLSYFAHKSDFLSARIPKAPIEWGNIQFKVDAVLFCGFLKRSKIVKQSYKSIWGHFSFKGKSFGKGTNQLHHYGNSFSSIEPYKDIRDVRLQCLVKDYYEKMEKQPV